MSLKGFSHARLACGCRAVFREGVEGSPFTVVIDDKAPGCQVGLHVRNLPIYDYREALTSKKKARTVAVPGNWKLETRNRHVRLGAITLSELLPP
jgi:hypothetical protein